MTDSSYGSPADPLPTRRSLRAAERAREQAAAEAEEAAKQAFLAQYEEERRNSQPADPFDDGYGEGDPFAHPAEDRSSAFYAAEPVESVFADVPAEPAAPEPAKPAPVTQTTVNYFAIAAIAISIGAAALTLLPAASVATLPVGLLALILAVIGVVRRKGGMVLPAVALIIALAAGGWVGWQQFAPSTEDVGATPAVISASSTGTNVNITALRTGATTTPPPGTVPAPYTATGASAGTTSITVQPAAPTDAVTCDITAGATVLAHKTGKAGQPITCDSAATNTATTTKGN